MNEFKWADGFDNGTIRDQLVFLKKFNINPNKFVYQLEDDSLDLNAINIEDLKQEFPNATITTYSNKSHRSTSCVQDELEETNSDFQKELTNDLISIIHHFSMKLYSNRRKKLKEIEKLIEYED